MKYLHFLVFNLKWSLASHFNFNHVCFTQFIYFAPHNIVWRWFRMCVFEMHSRHIPVFDMVLYVSQKTKKYKPVQNRFFEKHLIKHAVLTAIYWVFRIPVCWWKYNIIQIVLKPIWDYVLCAWEKICSAINQNVKVLKTSWAVSYKHWHWKHIGEPNAMVEYHLVCIVFCFLCVWLCMSDTYK